MENNVAEKKIRITVMNRTGHEEVEVDFNGAVDMMKDELGKGKWLRVMTNDGKNYIVTQLEVFNKDLESITQDILNAKSLILMSELKGGGLLDFRFDAEGYDQNGFDSTGYDRDGYDTAGFDEYGFDREGYNAQGFDENGLDHNGNPKVEPKTKIQVRVVKDAASASLIVVTQDAVVFNNAHGKEAFADAVARLSLAIRDAVPELMAGKAVVTDSKG